MVGAFDSACLCVSNLTRHGEVIDRPLLVELGERLWNRMGVVEADLEFVCLFPKGADQSWSDYLLIEV